MDWCTFLPIPTGSAACIWGNILVFHFPRYFLDNFVFVAPRLPPMTLTSTTMPIITWYQKIEFSSDSTKIIAIFRSSLINIFMKYPLSLLRFVANGSIHHHGKTSPSSPKAQWSHSQYSKTAALCHYTMQ